MDGPEVEVAEALARPTSSSLSAEAVVTVAGPEAAEVAVGQVVAEVVGQAAVEVAKPTSSRKSREEAEATEDGPEEAAAADGQREVVASHTSSPRSAEATDGRAKHWFIGSQ